MEQQLNTNIGVVFIVQVVWQSTEHAVDGFAAKVSGDKIKKQLLWIIGPANTIPKTFRTFKLVQLCSYVQRNLKLGSSMLCCIKVTSFLPLHVRN